MRNLVKLIILALCLAYASAGAEVLYDKYKDTDKMTIVITGKILKSDIGKFEKALRDLKTTKKKLHMNAVQLNSLGGQGYSAQEIGWKIRNSKLNTYLASTSHCDSACLYLLASGVTRMAYGEVTVHRATNDSKTGSDALIREEIETADFASELFLKEMGMGSLLIDAAINTPFWTFRILTDVEKRRWSLNGMDRISEELLFRSYARKLKISKQEFASKYVEHYDQCNGKAKNFEMLVIDCIASELSRDGTN